MLNITNIQTTIAQGELGKALDQVLQNADIKNSGHFNEAVLLKARLSQQERLDRMGVVSPGESAVNKNQINYAFLELLKRISKDKSEIVQSDISIGESDLTPEREKVTKILILTASPNNEARLDVNREIREIERTLRIARHRDKFVLVHKTAVTSDDLKQHLLHESPNIVHFSGHGTEHGIVLLDSNSTGKLVPNEALADMFMIYNGDEDQNDKIFCVFINACLSIAQARLIKNYVPYVIGMKRNVLDSPAILFSSTFYSALGAGKGIEFAFEWAKNSIDLNALPDSDVPVLLYQKGDGD